jgi:glutamate-5-semialdehyde dehydrogenase
LHGTGGAWLVSGATADPDTFERAVRHSLDRKVCNTLNVCCVLAGHADVFVPRFLRALTDAAGLRGTSAKLHVVEGSEAHVPADWFVRRVAVERAAGVTSEAQAELIDRPALGQEWEWEHSPEVSLVVVDSVDEATALCNELGPKLTASLVADDPAEHARFYDTIDAPFVGNGFTRWVDGQFALGRPELGLSNWQHGRLFARSAVLSGDSVFTVRTRAIQTDADLHR